jgi:DNA-nicking Smr family endonuclease
VALPSAPERINQPWAKLAELRQAVIGEDIARAEAERAKKKRVEEAARAEAAKRAEVERAKLRGEEDPEELFRRAMAGARPLGKPRDAQHQHPIRTMTRRERLGEDAEVSARLADLIDGRGELDVSETDEHVEGIAQGVDRGLLAQLRRGDFAVQAHLDLHGLNRDQAHDRVAQFLEHARRHGSRCVLLIHGRGLGSPDGVPVLKEELRGWLARGRLSRKVLAFATARRHDGGGGAMYVLLRR